MFAGNKSANNGEHESTIVAANTTYNKAGSVKRLFLVKGINGKPLGKIIVSMIRDKKRVNSR